MLRYNKSFLKDSKDTKRKDKLLEIKKFKSNLLNFSILNFSCSGVLGRLEALCLANISVIVLAWLLLAWIDSAKLEELSIYISIYF